jgi:hypothetical protein
VGFWEEIRMIDDFIETYSDVAPDGFCSHLISEFERLLLIGAGHTRQSNEGAPKHLKDDTSILLNVKQHCLSNFEGKLVDVIFFDALQNCFNRYSNYYSILKDCDVRASHMKMQKTHPTGGYHIFHTEQHKGVQANRAVAYTLYLNSIEEGGETEFLYQKKRVKPVENTLVFFPAGYTHPHRGNPVLGDTAKYIVTGWFYYEEF